MQEKRKGERNSTLDFLKGICIIFVIITHYEWQDDERIRFLFPFWIDMAVPIFMVITGYVSSLSFEKKGGDLKSYYHLAEFVSKLLRFIIPFIPAYLLAVLAQIIGAHHTFTAGELILGFMTGGTGRGSYYFPVMIQIVCYFPLIQQVIKKSPVVGVSCFFLANILFEAVKTWLNMPADLYRICSLRYLFILSFGCFLYYRGEIRHQIWYYLYAALGIFYIILCNYTAYEPKITKLWTVTSVFAVMLIVPLMSVLTNQRISLYNRVIEYLGKASYNIFLAQMIYYFAGDAIIYRFVKIMPVRVALNVIICCLAGVVFFMIESPVTRSIVKKIKSISVKQAS